MSGECISWCWIQTTGCCKTNLALWRGNWFDKLQQQLKSNQLSAKDTPEHSCTTVTRATSDDLLQWHRYSVCLHIQYMDPQFLLYFKETLYEMYSVSPSPYLISIFLFTLSFLWDGAVKMLLHTIIILWLTHPFKSSFEMTVFPISVLIGFKSQSSLWPSMTHVVHISAYCFPCCVFQGCLDTLKYFFLKQLNQRIET